MLNRFVKIAKGVGLITFCFSMAFLMLCCMYFTAIFAILMKPSTLADYYARGQSDLQFSIVQQFQSTGELKLVLDENQDGTFEKEVILKEFIK